MVVLTKTLLSKPVPLYRQNNYYSRLQYRACRAHGNSPIRWLGEQYRKIFSLRMGEGQDLTCSSVLPEECNYYYDTPSHPFHAHKKSDTFNSSHDANWMGSLITSYNKFALITRTCYVHVHYAVQLVIIIALSTHTILSNLVAIVWYYKT